MTATRENRNAGKVEDAVAAIGTSITVAEHLWSALDFDLPDDFPSSDALQNLRAAHDQLTAEVNGG